MSAKKKKKSLKNCFHFVAFRIKKKKRRVPKSHLRQVKTHFQGDDIEENNKETVVSI